MAKPFDPSLLEPDSADGEMQTCVCCDQEKPLNLDNFGVDSTTDTGFRIVCKECRVVNTNKREIIAQKKQVQKMEEKLALMLSDNDFLVDAPLVRGLSLQRLVDTIREHMHGEHGIALAWVTTFMKANSQTQAKMLESYMRNTAKVQELGDGAKTARDMSKDDLMGRLEQLVKTLGAERVNAMIETQRRARIPHAN